MKDQQFRSEPKRIQNLSNSPQDDQHDYAPLPSSTLPLFAPANSMTRSMRQTAVLQMQQTQGNRAVQRMLLHSNRAYSVQREDQPQAQAPHVGIIPIREFIRHVETVEGAYPNSSPQEILTMIRSMYYGSPAGSPGFDRLIPDAPNTGALYTCTDSEGSICREPVGTCTCVYAHGLAMDTPALQQAVRRLRERADENAIGDNPSPYIQVGKDLVDVGHVLVGIDAILHPRTDAPFTNNNLPSAPGPATWVGDVGAAMVYLQEHRRTGRKSHDVVGNPATTIEAYYQNSAPMTDILGDVDAYGIAQSVGPQTLSVALRQFYVSESGGSPRSQYNRWRGFAVANNLTFSQAGNTITWAPEARQTVIQRIMQFADLFADRDSRLGPVLGYSAEREPAVQAHTWPDAGTFADRFLQDLKPGIEQELARNTAPAAAGP